MATSVGLLVLYKSWCGSRVGGSVLDVFEDQSLSVTASGL